MSCQSTENITSPGELNKKPNPPTLTWLHPTAVNTTAGASTDVDLVAGQDQVCGHITISSNGSNIFITYYTDSGWTITETHIMVVADPSDFIVTSTGNPKVGQFPYGETGLSTDTTMTYVIPYPSGVVAGDTVFVGAHAVVEGNCEETVGANICANMPADGLWRWVQYVNPPPPNNQYYIQNAELRETEGGAAIQYVNGWCVDRDRSGDGGISVKVKFICTYDQNISCYVDKPENMPQVNWIINNKGAVFGLTMWDIQAAIWELLDNKGGFDDSGVHPDSGRVTDLLDLAAQHTDFTPGCDQIVAVIMADYNFDCSGTEFMQNFIIEIPVSCETNCSSETAWAFNYPIDGTSAEFPGANWFRYFGYLVN